MTETSKLDEPLSDVDYDELETFLGSNVVPQDCMDLEMLDGMLPIEALAYGDHDPEYLDWVDTEEKRLGMIDELPIATVLISRFWQERNRTDTPNRAERRAQRREASRKGRQRLH